MTEETGPNFLEGFQDLSSGTEIPASFALWCGISAVSAVLGRRLWLDMGTYVIYPNIMVILAAGSGRCRKSTAIGIAERLLKGLEPQPNFIEQKITPEGLISVLKVVQTEVNGGFVRETGEGFILADELANFLNKKSYESGLASLLIPLYDCKESFAYRTQSRGKEMIKNACLGMLAASTLDWIRSAIPVEAVGGGLTSRIIFVYDDNVPAPVARTEFSERKRMLSEKLSRQLARIAGLTGEVSLTDEAWDFYVQNYNEFYKKSPFYDNRLLSGYASRRHVHLLKVGMIFAASESKLTIEKRHLEGSELLLLDSERNLPRLMEIIVSSDRGALLVSILMKIQSSGGVSRKSLMRTYRTTLDSRGMDEILSSLQQSGEIKIVQEKGMVVYVPVRGG